MSEKGWSLSDAIYEVSEVRGEMSALLQPRARPAAAANKGKGKAPALVLAPGPTGRGKGGMARPSKVKASSPLPVRVIKDPASRSKQEAS